MEEEGDSDSASGYSAIDYSTGGTIDERSTFDFSVANHTVRRLPSIEATGEVDADCMGGEEIIPGWPAPRIGLNDWSNHQISVGAH